MTPFAGPAPYHARRAPHPPAVGGTPAALMGRRIRWLGVIMVVCLGLVIVQLVNIQLVKGKTLQDLAAQPADCRQPF